MKLSNTLWMGFLSVILLSGCSLFNKETDVVEISPLPNVENQFVAKNVWSIFAGNGIGEFYSQLSPTSQGNQIYAAGRNGVVKSINAPDGKQSWQVDLSSGQGSFLSGSKSALLSGGVSVFGDKVYVGSERSILYALNENDGSLAWKATAAGEILSKPIVSDDLVIVHTSNGVLQAFNESDGSFAWTTNLDVPVLTLRGVSTPAVAHGAAIVGGDNGRVSAFFLEQGQLIWQQRISQPSGATEIARLNDVDTTPIIVDNIVYALGYNGNLVALDLGSGQIVWRREIGSVHNFIIESDRIYLVDQDDRVMALLAESGNAIWRQSDLLHRKLTAPVLYNGYLVVGDSEGYLHWFDTTDGRFVSQQKLDGSGLVTAPIVVDDKLIIQSRDGRVYALKQ